MNRLGIEMLSVFGMPPAEYVNLVADLGCRYITTGLIADRGIATCLEPVVGLSIADLATAVAAVEYVGGDDVSLLIDTMHVARFGAVADDLRSLPPERIGYIQLSDTMLQPRMANYAEEAMFERLPPGEGELPLAAMLAALPDDRVVGLGIPMRSHAQAGISAHDRLRPCVQNARALLARTHDIY